MRWHRPAPGARNWGYGGVHPYTPQNSYGGPHGLQRLVGACHAQGLAVLLDVVYNDVGPEGSYLHDFGPYFTDRYHTPLGAGRIGEKEGYYADFGGVQDFPRFSSHLGRGRVWCFYS